MDLKRTSLQFFTFALFSLCETVSAQRFHSSYKDQRHCAHVDLRFRQLDGTCNHWKGYGSANTPVKRYLQPHYHDSVGMDKPRRYSILGRRHHLPSPRLVSMRLNTDRHRKSNHTMLLMQMGQLVDHDITQSPTVSDKDKTIRCCGVPKKFQSPECFPIGVPDTDKHFKHCMEFVRSKAALDPDGFKYFPREQINSLTAFIDGSCVYGDNVEKMRRLRTRNGKGALLKTRRVNGRPRLPKDQDSECLKTSHPLSYCQMAGDSRVNEQPGLSSLHLVFHLQHNTIVRRLAEGMLKKLLTNPTSQQVKVFLANTSDELKELLFQEARKIVSAMLQKITFCDWLPLVIGPRLLRKYGLGCDKPCQYDPNADPRIANAFLTAAFRFGHSLVPNKIMVDNKPTELQKLFDIPDATILHFESIASSLCESNLSEPFDRFVSRSLTTKLFRTRDQHLDLVALNIQRGRDHGIPPYYDWKKYFGLRKFLRPEQLRGGYVAKTLKELYRHPRDVDLFTAGLLERRVPGGIVGPTFGNILAHQFSDLKFGDAYFFLTTKQPQGFTADQRQALMNVSMSQLICSTSKMRQIQQNPFLEHSERNPHVECQSLPALDLDPWIDV